MVLAPLDSRTFNLSGTHYEIGYAIGQGSPPFALPGWWPEPPPLTFARACASQIAAVHVALLEELYGHADAQQQSYDQLLRILCRHRLGGRPVSVPEQGGCTSLAWRTSTGHVVIGRNYDFYPVQRIRQRIHLRPAGVQATVGMRGSVPCGRYDGVNEAGLFVSLHVVLADRVDDPHPAIPFHLIPRILLERCASMQEAVHEIMALPHLHSFNYLIADPGGYVAVEAHPDRVRLRYPERDILAVGNFYQHPDMFPLQRNRRQLVSRGRVAFLESERWQQGVPSTDPLAAVARAMSDHEHQVCGHDGGHTTLWACAADLTARQIRYAPGAPCREPYEQIEWPEEGRRLSTGIR